MGTGCRRRLAHGIPSLAAITAVLLGSGLLVQSAPAAEAQPAGDSAALQEITVTATRRSLEVIEVPMAMTVISPAALEAQEIKTFNDSPAATQIPPAVAT